MEASATTLNIESAATPAIDPSKITSPAPDEPIRKRAKPARGLRHSDFHGPNFGRYVAGCEACAAKYPNGPGTVPVNKQRKRWDTSKGVAAAANAATEQTAAMAAQMANSSSHTITALMDQIDKLTAVIASGPAVQPVATNSTDELVRLMLRKEGKAIEKEELEAARLLEAREQMLKVEMERIRQQEERQAHCGHTKENGRPSWMASQIHNDGMIHPVCSHCFMELEPRLPARA